MNRKGEAKPFPPPISQISMFLYYEIINGDISLSVHPFNNCPYFKDNNWFYIREAVKKNPPGPLRGGGAKAGPLRKKKLFYYLFIFYFVAIYFNYFTLDNLFFDGH